MSPKQLKIMVEALLISAVFVIGGCNATTHQPPRTVYEAPRLCYRDSETFNLSFAFPCEEKETARAAGVVCDFMGASARALIELNRQIGPTTPENLLGTALPVIKELVITVYDVLGKDAAKVYLQDIKSMGYYIAQRNITDLITYPEQKCRNCLKEFNYVVN